MNCVRYLCVSGLAKQVIYCKHFVKLLCLHGSYTFASIDVAMLAGLLLTELLLG